jgi:hypothetical protein
MAMPPTVNYATPATRPDVPTVQALGIGAVALVVGMLTANPFAEAVGFSPISDASAQPGTVFGHMGCGAVMALAAGVAAVFLYRFFFWLRAALASARGRPQPGVVVALLIVGAACVLGSLVTPFYFSISQSTVAALLGEALAILTFILGAAVTSVAIWGSLREQATSSPPPAVKVDPLPAQSVSHPIDAQFEDVPT